RLLRPHGRRRSGHRGLRPSAPWPQPAVQLGLRDHGGRSMSGLLSLSLDAGVALVTLERPEKRNAQSIELRLELADAFARLAEDGEVGCAVLTGAGSAFCSGMDT